MAEFENRWATDARTQTGVAVDEGLRSYMLRVFNFMGLGVAFTAIVSLVLMMNPQLMATIAIGPGKWVLFAGILGMGFFAHRIILTGSTAMAHGAYWLYCALWGAFIAPMVYSFLATGQSGTVTLALAITAVTFFSMSLIGYTTKKNLSAFGTFFVMATIGLLLAMLANYFFFQSSMMSLVVSALVVLVFAGITAWETQAVKEMYYEGDSRQQETGKAIFGAFMLYGSFVTIFIHVLNILGIMGGD